MARVGPLVVALTFVVAGCSLKESLGIGAAQQPPAELALKAVADLQARSGSACVSSMGADLAIPDDLDALVADARPGWLWEGTLWIGRADGLIAALGGRLIGQANGFVIVNRGTGIGSTSDQFREQELGGRRVLMLVSRDRAAPC
jgi:hypothetical protein